MGRIVIDGTCPVCGKEAKIFASPNYSDAGPWVCDACAKVVEGYLLMTGYVLSIPVPLKDRQISL
jgi:hypothetical protein